MYYVGGNCIHLSDAAPDETLCISHVLDFFEPTPSPMLDSSRARASFDVAAEANREPWQDGSLVHVIAVRDSAEGPLPDPWKDNPVGQVGTLAAIVELVKLLPPGNPLRAELVETSSASLDAAVAGLGKGVTFRPRAEAPAAGD